jgi:hypothetical protein
MFSMSTMIAGGFSVARWLCVCVGEPPTSTSDPERRVCLSGTHACSDVKTSRSLFIDAAQTMDRERERERERREFTTDSKCVNEMKQHKVRVGEVGAAKRQPEIETHCACERVSEAFVDDGE